MSAPNHFPPSPPSLVHKDPRSFPTIGPRDPQTASDPDPGRETRESRPRWSTSAAKKRSRSSSTPPDKRPVNDDLQPGTRFVRVSADGSRAWAQDMQRGWTTGSVEVGVQVQTQGQIKMGGSPPTQSTTRPEPRHRRNSVGHHPPGRISISSPVDSPVIPGITTSITRAPSRHRRDSYQRPRILFYHKHEPHYGFTNFSDHAVMYEGKVYPTSEHLFQSFKFTHRPGLAEHIRTCSSRPSDAFSEARRFAMEVRPDWTRENINAMDVTIFHKFTQHRDLKHELLSTGTAELVENSDKDAFWGCGADGMGRNELGKALERLRTQLREAERR